MKNLSLVGLCLSFIFSSSTLFAQAPVPVNEPDLKKPLLFANLPDRIPLETAYLKSLFTGTEGKEINMSLGKSQLEGKVVSNISKYNTIRSVTIRSSNFNGASLTLSSSTKTDGTVKITGRLLSLQHGDLYELEKEGEQYVLIKKNFYDLINE